MVLMARSLETGKLVVVVEFHAHELVELDGADDGKMGRLSAA